MRDWAQNIIPGYDLPSIHKSDLARHCVVCNISIPNENVYKHHLVGKNHLKNIARKANHEDSNDLQLNEEDKTNKEEAVLKEIAYYEYKIKRIKELFNDVIENTKNIIREKQSMNLDEIEADVIDEKELDQIEFNEEDEKKIYNPKNVPLGWDGKPIPYWLYKLHGLGVEHKCEICDGASYWGLNLDAIFRNGGIRTA
jgi:splicing factor 3A subunit 3